MSNQDIAKWKGDRLMNSQGDALGTIEEIFVHGETGEPTWLAIDTGQHATDLTFVPIDGAHSDDGEIVVPYDKDLVLKAPHAESWDDLDSDEQTGLYDYYKVDHPVEPGDED